MFVHLPAARASRSALLAIAALATLCGSAAAATITVPKDFPTVQAAVDAAGDGDTVLVKGGSYAESVVVASRSDFVLKGKGGAKIVTAATGPIPLTILDCNRVRVTGLVVEGGNDDGILVLESVDVKVDKCRVGAGDGHGIGVADSSGVTIERCRVEDRGSHGIFVRQDGLLAPTDCHIVKCTVLRAGRWGIRTGHGTGHEILKCKVFDANTVGIEMFSSDGSMERNVVKRTSVFATLAVRGSGNVCRGNRGSDAALEGIFVLGSDHLVEQNRLKNVVDGIWCLNVDNTIVRKNRVTRATRDGIRLSGAGINTIDRNKVKTTGESGVEVQSTLNVLTGNGVKRAGLDGFTIGGDDNDFTSNKVSRSAGSGFLIQPTATGNTLTTNQARKSGTADLEDQNPGQNTFVDNDFKTTIP